MVKIEGTYELQSQENYKDYLVSLGLSEEQALKLSELQEKIIISSETNKVIIDYGGKAITFPVNKELEYTLATNKKVWTTVTLNDDGITFKTKLTEDGSLGEDKVFKFSEGELTSTSTNTKGVKAVRKYKRV